MKPSSPLEGIFLSSIVLIVLNKTTIIIIWAYVRREGTESFYQCDVT